MDEPIKKTVNEPETETAEKKFVLNISEEEFSDYGEIITKEEDSESPEETLPTPEEEQKEKKIGKEKNNEHKGLFLAIKILIAVIILGICALISMVIIYAVGDVFGLKESEESILVEVEPNTTAYEVADLLAEKGVIDYPLVFRAYLKYGTDGVNFKFGKFTLHPSMPYMEIIDILQTSHNAENVISVSIPEGYNVVDIANTLEESGVCAAEDFLNEAKSADNYVADYPFLEGLSDSDLRFFQLEGYLYPDTYEFYLSAEPSTVIRKFLDNFAVKFDEEMQEKAVDLGKSVDEILILASIIQAEAPKDEMGMVSSVYWNRLNHYDEFKRMQSDPTRGYSRDVLASQGASAETVEAYNTYVGFGLPPGAIGNPGMDAMEAALNPKDSNYYYFCTNLSTGEFFYASDYNTHQRNLAQAGLTE